DHLGWLRRARRPGQGLRPRRPVVHLHPRKLCLLQLLRRFPRRPFRPQVDHRSSPPHTKDSQHHEQHESRQHKRHHRHQHLPTHRYPHPYRHRRRGRRGHVRRRPPPPPRRNRRDHRPRILRPRLL